MTKHTLHLGDCLDVLRTLPDNSVDAVVTDPPYGLSFMGKRWDYDVPAVEVWAECLRLLKPGGHLLAFAGTRTQHRMAVRIEDAGFEIRDMIAWVYGSGFPKSLDVSKAIDSAAGAVREVVGVHVQSRQDRKPGNSLEGSKDASLAWQHDITAPATDLARQWQGWGTSLKPSLETVTFASKPFTDQQEWDTIASNLVRLEARLWLLSFASAADQASTSNQKEFDEVCAIARWTADDVTNTRGALCAQMDMSRFALATSTALSIVSSWRHTLIESLKAGSTSTTETRSSTTIDLKILRFSLSQITPGTITKACSLPGGFNVNASNAERHFSVSLSLLQSIHALSVTALAMSLEAENSQAEAVKPNLDPCIMARKPLVGTVAETVTTWGTGAINVDGCRVGTSKSVPSSPSTGGQWYGDGGEDGTESGHNPNVGRFPANLIHDGSDEVVGLFPETTTGKPTVGSQPTTGEVFGAYAQRSTVGGGDSGSAARFFYCAKASKADRDDGCDALPFRESAEMVDRDEDSPGIQSPRAGAGRKNCARNFHPTVKPTDLMRYLCRLVTPPGGTVLDPFMGSGSTGRGALEEGFRFIGIERDPEYFKIAEVRIPPRQPRLF